MRIAVVQTHPEFGRVESNVRRALALIEATDADLFVFPELFNTGYNFESAEEAEALSEDVQGPTFRVIADAARLKRCHMVYGFAERADRLYNASALVGPGGLVGLYRKVHLFYRENLFFSPGNLGFPVFDTPAGRIGIMICFDWIYPEAARALALKGAQVIAHPSNLVLPYCPDAMITRCLENRVYAATADRTGSEERGGIPLSFIGTSEIVAPGGDVLVRLGREEEAVGVADVDLSRADSKFVNTLNDIFRDRRPDQYGT